MQQEHRTLDEVYVPEPRSADHDGNAAAGTAHADGHHDADAVDTAHADGHHDHDDSVAVGTAHADGHHDPDHADADESYPAGTYASGSAADPDVQDDVEVVDRDTALAEERDGRDSLDADGTYSDDPEARTGTEDAAADPADDAEDRAWAAEHATELRAGSVGTDPLYSPDDPTAVAATDRTDDPEDRAWAADHATQLRAGSTDTDRADIADTDHTDHTDSTTTLPADPDAGNDSTLAVSEAAEDRYAPDDSYTSEGAGRTGDEQVFTPVSDTIEDTTDTTDTHHGADVADRDHGTDDTVAGRDYDTAADADVDAGAGHDFDTTTAATTTDPDTVTATDVTTDADTATDADVIDATTDDQVVVVPVDTAGQSAQELRPGAAEPAPIGEIWAAGAADGLRDRWRELQLRFIDDPSSVAGEADELVGEVVASVAASLQAQRQQLSAWRNDGIDDTEQLRSAVRQYRDFFNKLLGL